MLQSNYLTQFITENSTNKTLQMVSLGTIFIILVILIFGSLAYFAGYVESWLKKNEKFSKYMNILSAIIFIGLGIKIALLKL